MLYCPISIPKRLLLSFFPTRRLVSATHISEHGDEHSSISLSSSSSATTSYLVNTWLLSPAAAAAVARRVRIKDPFKPNLTLQLLKDHSFTQAQIASLVSRRPDLLRANPRKRLKPKIEFFHRMGLAGTDFAKLVTANPSILFSSLDGKIVSSVNYLKGLVGTDENVIATLKRDPWLLHSDLEKFLTPNIKTLRDEGMPEPVIAQLMVKLPRYLKREPERFSTIVSDLKELGYNVSTSMFVYAFPVISGMSSSLWNAKVEAYRSCGWSDDEIIRAFRKHPDFMLKSVERIRHVMDFLMGKLHLDPNRIIMYPNLVTCSLEKTIIPRCCVLNILLSKGILEKDSNMAVKLHLTKARFLRGYVTPYVDQSPELLDAYEGRMEFNGFGL